MIENNFGHTTWRDIMSEITENTRITFTTDANPKRKGSQAHSRFQKYMKAKTVAEYLKLGGTPADLRYDAAKGFIEFTS